MKCIADYQVRVLEKQEIECSDLETLMCDYAEGDLTASLKDRLDQHATECENCRDFMNSYLATIKIAATLKPAAPDVDMQNRLRKALNERLGISLQPIRPE